MTYATNEDWAKKKDHASWAAFALASPNNPTETHVNELLEEAGEIINENIGSYSTDITSTTYTSRLQKLCLRMVDRMLQIEEGQGMEGKIPLFSPNDFLIERERTNLKNIGKALGYRKVGKVKF